MRFQNSELAALVPGGRYGLENLSRIEAALEAHGTLTFSRLPSGLFAASPAGASISSSGYSNVWVRDNVYVAFAHHVCDRTEVAAGVARALMTFFDRYRHRFEDIISGAVKPAKVSMRPHVRFDGRSLEEIADEQWPHAQNDALGYFLWLYAGLARDGHVALDEPALTTLSLFPRYFEKITYWQDEDSGHWEETRKISASSIGAVVAGLDAIDVLASRNPSAFRRPPFGPALVKLTRRLAKIGRSTLDRILPQECAQISPAQNRRYDAALFFLLFPLGVITSEEIADLVLHDVDRFLSAGSGIRRYLGDSYWAPDYEERVSPEDRTRNYSEDMPTRDVLLERIGDEAQWCLFDPLLSAYYGRRFLVTKLTSDIERQTLHFNRALSQISASWRCQELYYLRRGEYVSNPHSPLQWTQANLLIALHDMHATLEAEAHRLRSEPHDREAQRRDHRI